MTPGEAELSPYCSFLSTQALVTQFAVAIRAAVILIERASTNYLIMARHSPIYEY